MGLPERLVTREGAGWQATLEPSESQQCEWTVIFVVDALGFFFMFMTSTVVGDPLTMTALTIALDFLARRLPGGSPDIPVLVVGLSTCTVYLLGSSFVVLVLVPSCVCARAPRLPVTVVAVA